MPNLLDGYGEMFTDRVTLKVLASAKDPSGGRSDAWTVLATGVACSVQPATEQDMMAAHALGVEIQSQVYFPDDPGDLSDGSMIVVETLSGVAPSPAESLAVRRLRRPGMPDLVLWIADCQGRV
jgi:head-tail adaptor